MPDNSTASGRYGTLEADRFPYLERARDAAKLTIPSLVPPVAASAGTRLPTPYQSVGARGVNNLSAKLLLALFPPNQPFLRLEIGDLEVEKFIKDDPTKKAAFDAALAQIERSVQTDTEQNAIRVPVFEAIKHLIVAGNVLVYMKPKGGIRLFHLRNFVVRRSPGGEVYEIITKEMIAPDQIPASMLEVGSGSEEPGDGSGTVKSGTDKNVELFTWIKCNPDGSWKIHQELKGKKVPGSQGSYPKDRCPWLPLRWTTVDGEDYGRGFVEEYQGDLQSLEGLSQAIVEGSAAMAKVLFLVKPNGTTKQNTISASRNGDVKEGDGADVSVLQVEKQADFRVAAQTADTIEKRLSFAFMLNSAIQRDAERVTSAEIRYMAQELETSLGGLYSLLAQDFQLPYVRVRMAQMSKQGTLPPLPKTIKPVIVTGLEALGRGNDLDRLNQFMAEITPLGPQVIAQYLIVPDYMTRVATGVGIDTTGLIKPQAQVDQETAQANQQAQANEAMQSAVPHLAKAAADGVKEVAVHHATSPQGPAPGAPGPGPVPAPLPGGGQG